MINKRLELVMLLFTVFVVIIVGMLVFFEYAEAVQSYYDEYGEWPDPGAPPVMFNPSFLVVVVGVSGGILLFILRNDNKELKK